MRKQGGAETVERFLEYELEQRTLEDLLEELGCPVYEAFIAIRQAGLLDEELLERYLESFE